MASHRTEEKKMAKAKKRVDKEPTTVVNNKSMDPKKSKRQSSRRSGDGTQLKRQKTSSSKEAPHPDEEEEMPALTDNTEEASRAQQSEENPQLAANGNTCALFACRFFPYRWFFAVTEAEMKNVKEEIAVLAEKIGQVEREIGEVKLKRDAAAVGSELWLLWNNELKQFREKEGQLRKNVDQLRTEKILLLEKEKEIRHQGQHVTWTSPGSSSFEFLCSRFSSL